MLRLRHIAGFFLALVAAPVAALATCRDTVFEDRPYSVCTVTAGQDLRLFQSDRDGAILGSFTNVNALLKAEGKTLTFAMNAGMYHPNRAPVGLLITNGQERARLITSDGPGNFGLLPNGVFCVGDGGFAVIESRRFGAKRPKCLHATQSGPMLVINGALHPRFLPDSDSRFIRNGVGVSADGQTAFLVISGEPVNFSEFGRMFRDGLSTPNALYFDGKISRLFAPELGRSDFGFQMGPIIGLAAPLP